MSNYGDDVPKKRIKVKRPIPQISMDKYSRRMRQLGDRIRQPITISVVREKEHLMEGVDEDVDGEEDEEEEEEDEVEEEEQQ